jgi:hypothetical protein
MIEIETRNGTAELIWDGASDPASPGWFLRYTDPRSGQVLDEILDGDDPDGGESLRAETQARDFLAARSLI